MNAAQHNDTKSDKEDDGVEWATSNMKIPAILAGIMFSLTWFASSVYLAVHPIFKPLDYFQRLSEGHYNILITGAGSVMGAIIGYGISVLIRQKLLFLFFYKGVKISSYETLVTISTQSILKKTNSSAILCLLVFALANQIGSAAQAAYGASTASTNISIPQLLTIDLEGSSAILPQIPLSFDSDLSAAMRSAAVSLLPGEAGAILYYIGDYLQEALPNSPLAPMSILLSISAQTTKLSYPIDSHDQSLIKASFGNNVGYATLQGVFAETTCSITSADWNVSSLSASLLQARGVASCGQFDLVYSSSAGFVYDAVSCPSVPGKLLLLMANVTQSDIQILSLLECNSALYSQYARVSFYDRQSAGRIDNVIGDAVLLNESALAIFNIIDSTYWASGGPNGIHDLQLAYNIASQPNVSFIEIATAIVSSVYSVGALDFVQALTLRVNAPGASPLLASTNASGVITVQVIKIGLLGLNAIFLIVPLGMLLLNLWALTAVFYPISGKLDLTNCKETLLCALGSDIVESTDGGCTGNFANKGKDPRVWLGTREPTPGGQAGHIFFSGLKTQPPIYMQEYGNATI